MDNVILTVDKIVKKYPNFLLDNISFDLQEGTITGFIGKNVAVKKSKFISVQNAVVWQK